jgi:cytochrome P450
LLQMADQRVYSGWKQNKLFRNVLGEESKVEKHKKALAKCVKKVLDEKRAANWEKSRTTQCLLDELMTIERFSEEEIATTLEAFIVLGYDRLSASTCSALLELSQREKVQETILRK